jgi:hypothetical protein
MRNLTLLIFHMKPLLLILFSSIWTGLSAQDILKATNGSVITVQNGAVLYVNGGMNLDDGSRTNNDGTINIQKTASGSADFTDNTGSPYNYGGGRFVFSGTGAQNVKSLNQFERIDVSNAGFNLASNVKANGWYLKSGVVNTGTFMAIATSGAATAVQADASNTNYSNSWINGTLQRFITPATVNSYLFPLGNATGTNMAEMDNAAAGPLTGVSIITASFGPKPGNDNGLNVSESGTPYSIVNSGGVWYLTPDANPTGGAYNLKLYFNNFSGLTDNSFGILDRPTVSSNAADWIVPAGSSLPSAGSLGRTVVGEYALRNNISTFSQFGIGMSVTPLPLELLSFTAMKKDKSVVLNWETTNEVNTSHFEVYRADQFSQMQYLGRVAAAGNSALILDYSFTDDSPLSGFNFYQLKMVDIDNRFQMSRVVEVYFEDAVSFTVYPNPVMNNEFYVQHEGTKVNWVKLFSVDGRQIDCDMQESGPHQTRVRIPSMLANGTYVVQTGTDKGIKTTTILVP